MHPFDCECCEFWENNRTDCFFSFFPLRKFSFSTWKNPFSSGKWDFSYGKMLSLENGFLKPENETIYYRNWHIDGDQRRGFRFSTMYFSMIQGCKKM